MRPDVVIIGTGPAGGMAACRLAASGARVLLLERARLPRSKPCGGALTGDASQMLGRDVSPRVEARIHTSRWLIDHQRPVEIRSARPLLMVNRRDFDLQLVEHALSLARDRMELRDGFAVAGVEEDAAGVWVRGRSGEGIRARYVIGADGALGRTARSLGLGRRTPPGAAVDAEVEVAPEVFETERDHVTFNLACVPNGYGWIFPKAGYLSCGVGSWGTKGNLLQALDEYLRRSFPAGAIRAQRRRGHPIPLWAGHAPLSTARVCLAGDAASLVDPILGEGIRFALQSGRTAAEVVLALLGDESAWPAGTPTDCHAYGWAINQGMGAELERLRRFVLPLFLRSPELFFRRFYEEGRSYFALARALSARLSSAASAPCAASAASAPPAPSAPPAGDRVPSQRSPQS